MSVAVRTWCGTVQPSSSEDREHVKVYLRVRPFTATEAQNGESQVHASIWLPKKHVPCYHILLWKIVVIVVVVQVYGPDATQRELFQGTAKDLVQDVLHGGNSLLFTYGVTNAGKTFTFLGPDGDAGILPRSLDAIFSSMEGKVSTGPSIKPQRCREFVSLSEEQRAEEAAFKDNLLRHLKEVTPWPASCHDHTAEDHLSLQVEADSKFSIWVSFCEIYKENIHDLLEAAPGGAARRTPLRLSQDVKGNTFVKDLRWVQVDSAHEAYQVMKLGKKNQSFSSTGINQLSSRSHSIFSIRILRMKDDQSARVVAVSELCLCDLAGSERCAKTQNWGERLKEAGNINTSLLILGKCISALRHNQHAKLLQHVPFRESKLTHYLQSFFCGRGKVCMMVNVNQCASTYDETLQVLKFSALAQKVRTLRAAMFFFFVLWKRAQVANEMLRAEQASTQLQAAQEHITALGQDLRDALDQQPSKATARESAASESRTSDPLPVKDLAREKLWSEQLRENVGLRHAAQEFREQRRMVRDLRERLREGQEASDKQLEEVGRELCVQEASCRRLRQELSEQELTTERLKRELQEASAGRCAAEEDLGRANAALAAQVASSKAEEEKTAKLLKDEEVQTEQLHMLATPIKASQPQVSLHLLKELAKQDSDKVQSLSANLQRKEEDSSDLREKLADYKKQIQQVHKDISSMKEEERLLRQKLSDVERLKKQLQSDLTNRDRTIQQLKAVELEAKQRLVDDMRSALAEQEETQEQMERMLDDKLHLIQELNNGKTYGQSGTISSTARLTEPFSLFEEKHLTERQKWQEEKMALIGQIKEAEDKRNQEMKKFAEDRERYLARQAELVSYPGLKSAWSRVAGGGVAETESHATSLKEDSELGSSGCPSVLESSEISTENGRASRFPQPEMEISFSPLQPDRMALRRRGDPSAVTVKITRSNRKRKSADMDKVGKRPSDRDRGQSRSLAPSGSRMARTRKDATLQKIGDFLQSSPTLIGSKGESTATASSLRSASKCFLSSSVFLFGVFRAGWFSSLLICFPCCARSSLLSSFSSSFSNIVSVHHRATCRT
uniref:Kinesin family member 20Ba n=1 Tax=Hippocampus comes TaxID=109280 RepID=A0A3Q2YCK5_HIPCM